MVFSALPKCLQGLIGSFLELEPLHDCVMRAAKLAAIVEGTVRLAVQDGPGIHVPFHGYDVFVRVNGDSRYGVTIVSIMWEKLDTNLWWEVESRHNSIDDLAAYDFLNMVPRDIPCIKNLRAHIVTVRSTSGLMWYELDECKEFDDELRQGPGEPHVFGYGISKALTTLEVQ